jgi:hypothetical protein
MAADLRRWLELPEWSHEENPPGDDGPLFTRPSSTHVNFSCKISAHHEGQM